MNEISILQDKSSNRLTADGTVPKLWVRQKRDHLFDFRQMLG